MKFRKKLFANIGYTGKMIVLMWRNDKTYLFYIILDIIAYSSLTFLNMYLVQQSIQMLEPGAEIKTYRMETCRDWLGMLRITFSFMETASPAHMSRSRRHGLCQRAL